MKKRLLLFCLSLGVFWPILPGIPVSIRDAQEKSGAEPELCVGDYLSEPAARHLGLELSRIANPVCFEGVDESGVLIERPEMMRVFDDGHARPAHALRDDRAISAALDLK